MSLLLQNAAFATKAVHAGSPSDPSTGAVIPPISLSTTFQQKSPGVHQGYEYARTGNPTRKSFEDCVASLENGGWGVAYASGMAAISAVVHLLKNGDEIVSIDDVYGGTFRYFTKIAVPHGVQIKFVDFSVPGAFESSLTPNTKMVWIETPTNPNLKIVDIRSIASAAKKHDDSILVVVDNTFLSPFFQKPLDLGADLVLHSVTKYLNGHCDVVMGVVVGRAGGGGGGEEVHKRLKFLQNSIGAVPSPFECYMALRGVKTLHLRMKCHEENAHKVAEFLSKSNKVEKVHYPGLKSHPQHDIALKQMTGFGGMVTFWLKGGIIESRQFLENLHLFTLAESLGGVESLANHPAIMTHASVTPENRRNLGIHDNMIRLSVGVEDVDDLISDIENALDSIKSSKL